jgi:monofunctional biosynthetic peptidoglycan transglycosylase
MNKPTLPPNPLRNDTAPGSTQPAPERITSPGRLFRRTLHLIRLIVVFFVVSTVAVTLLYRFVPPPATPLMLLRLWDQFQADEPLTLKKDWTPLAEMSPWMPAAVITAEDQRFFEHHGFDFTAIEKARAHNERALERQREGGRSARLRGASTISQQTAKNVFLWPARSWTRKGLEVWFTFLIETLWSKERILEVYLNVAETGNGLYGAPIAAQHYFGRDVKRLTRTQAARIAAILPKPRSWSAAYPPRRVLRKQARLIRQMPGFYRRYDE